MLGGAFVEVKELAWDEVKWRYLFYMYFANWRIK